MADKQSMIFHFEWFDMLEDFTDEEIGQLTVAIYKYARSGEDTSFSDRAMRSVFKAMKSRVASDIEKYEERCQQNAENGKKGGRPKKQTVSEKTEGFLEKPKKADSVTDCVTDSDIDIDIECVTVTADAGASGDTHTREIVRAFFREQGFTSDPDKFIDYNLGRDNAAIFDKPKRWQAVARNWEKAEKKSQHPPDMMTHGTRYADIEHLIFNQ